MSRIEAVSRQVDRFLLETAVTDLGDAPSDWHYFVREVAARHHSVPWDGAYRVFARDSQGSVGADTGAVDRLLLEWVLGERRRPLSSYLQGLCGPGSSVDLIGEMEMDSPSLSIGPSATSDLRHIPGVSVRRGAEVEDVLAAVGLTRVAVSTLTALQRYFPDAELVVDRERPENEAGLIRIDVFPAPSYREVADEVLDRFDEGWWLKQPPGVRSRIGVYVA
ncbi:MAG: hypothetical protein ACNA8N_09100 [Trueperaceae bacterium]